MTRDKRRRLLRVQRVAGLLLITVCLIVVFMASKGTTVEDRDILPVFLFFPMGLVWTVSRSVQISEDADELVDKAANAIKSEVKYFVSDCIDFIEAKLR